MKQQSAIDFFIEELEEKGELRETIGIVQLNIDTSEYLDLKRKAKEMEKQQQERLIDETLNAYGIIDNLNK
jgi:hypothetical protein